LTPTRNWAAMVKKRFSPKSDQAIALRKSNRLI